MRKGKIVLTTISAIMLLVFTIGGFIADRWRNMINDYFEIRPYRVELIGEDEQIDAEYFKSNYVQKDKNNEIIYVTDPETGYRHQLYDDVSLYETGKNVAYNVQREGMVVLWNSSTKTPNVKGLPVTDNNISVFGKASTNMANSGVGSGQASVQKTGTFRNFLTDVGYNVNSTLWNFYKNDKNVEVDYASGRTYETVYELPWSAYTSAVKNSFESYGDCAFIMITRVSGEYDDCMQTGSNTVTGDYLSINANEKQMIEEVIKLKNAGAFKKIVFLLNTATSLNFEDWLPYRSDVDACIWIGQPGKEAHLEIAKVLRGVEGSVPTGHLPDTYVYNGKSAPAAANSTAELYTNYKAAGLDSVRQGRYINYTEGIYVGYKYYETRYEDAVMNVGGARSEIGAVNSASGWTYKEEVAFPFGYGGDFSEFRYSDFSLTKNTDNEDYTARVTVTNVGNTPSQDAVQIYVQKPYTDYDKSWNIEQASVNLCGFAKTKMLEVGESVEVVINIDDYCLRTYDSLNNETYIREAGDYYFTVGHDSHDAINNILAKKGYTPANTDNVMDAAGNSSMVHVETFFDNDYETYSYSSTGTKITNQFNDTDWLMYENSPGTGVTYLSRENWASTYPLTRTMLTLNAELIGELGYATRLQQNSDDVMPTFGAEIQYMFIDMKGIAFDDERWQTFLDQLTLDEMIQMMGNAYHGNREIIRLGVPREWVFDGPLGTRSAYDTNLPDQWSVNYPIAPLVAATFNPELVETVGVMKGEDMLHIGYTGIYGTAAGIHRTIWGGRAYEYYSEDGFLSGVMCAQETLGIQSKGCVVNIKHVVLNDQENYRWGMGVWANEQSIREIYLEAFRPAVEDAHAKGLMSSFNRMGTEWAGAHEGLLTNVLRGEWGFDGYVISDCPYFDYMNIVDGLAAGNDCMLYEIADDVKQASYYTAENNPTVAKYIRQSAHRILYVMVNSSVVNGLTPNQRFIPITTWWEYTIFGCQAGFGVLTALGCLSIIFKRDE